VRYPSALCVGHTSICNSSPFLCMRGGCGQDMNATRTSVTFTGERDVANLRRGRWWRRITRVQSVLRSQVRMDSSPCFGNGQGPGEIQDEPWDESHRCSRRGAQSLEPPKVRSLVSVTCHLNHRTETGVTAFLTPFVVIGYRMLSPPVDHQ
jgi:hypothetical protein